METFEVSSSSVALVVLHMFSAVVCSVAVLVWDIIVASVALLAENFLFWIGFHLCVKFTLVVLFHLMCPTETDLPVTETKSRTKFLSYIQLQIDTIDDLFDDVSPFPYFNKASTAICNHVASHSVVIFDESLEEPTPAAAPVAASTQDSTISHDLPSETTSEMDSNSEIEFHSLSRSSSTTSVVCALTTTTSTEPSNDLILIEKAEEIGLYDEIKEAKARQTYSEGFGEILTEHLASLPESHAVLEHLRQAHLMVIMFWFIGFVYPAFVPLDSDDNQARAHHKKAFYDARHQAYREWQLELSRLKGVRAAFQKVAVMTSDARKRRRIVHKDEVKRSKGRLAMAEEERLFALRRKIANDLFEAETRHLAILDQRSIAAAGKFSECAFRQECNLNAIKWAEEDRVVELIRKLKDETERINLGREEKKKRQNKKQKPGWQS